jgi:hypothetical protein
VISLSPYQFLDSSLNFLVFLECLLIVESLNEFLFEHVISYLFSFNSHCFECMLCLKPFLLLVFCIFILGHNNLLTEK